MHNCSSYSFCDSERGDSDVNLCVPIVALAVDNSPARLCLLCNPSSVQHAFSVYSLRFKTSNRVLRGGADEENTTRRCCREEDLRPKISTTAL